MNDRVDITENFGATNTINELEFYELVRATCDHIYALLTEHCGPTAKDALIITDNPPNLKDRHFAVFTKDGINIVKSIEFMSPIQRHIQSLVVYVGSRVESLSHDGTTTSMLLFTNLVSHYMTKIINACNAELMTLTTVNDVTSIEVIKLNRREIQAQFVKELSDIFVEFEEHTLTVDRLVNTFGITDVEAVRFVAYHQAMISSKGDMELTKAIVDVIETLPVELYGYFQASQSRIETDKRFIVVTDDFDFELPVVANMDHMNHQMQTEYLAETCDLIISEDDLVQGNQALVLVADTILKLRPEAFPITADTTAELIDIENAPTLTYVGKDTLIPEHSYISLVPKYSNEIRGVWFYAGPGKPLTRPERRKDLVIITKSLDSALMAKIQEINWRSPNKVIIFQVSTPNQYSSICTVLSALSAVAGRYSLQDHLADASKEFLISDAKIHYKHRRLFVSNLYKKDGSLYHPYFNNPEAFLPYTQMVNAIRTTLDDYASGRLRIESSSDDHRERDYISIYRRMVCAEVRNLQIAGRTHDVLSDYDVFMDTFGAVLSSLKSGFVLDGYLKLYSISKKLSTDASSITRCLFDILQDTHQTTSTISINKQIEQYNKSNEKTYCYYLFGRNLQKLTGIIDCFGITCDANDDAVSTLTDDTILIQPADTYRELNKRILDLVPKLINTVRAIIPGTTHNQADK